MNDVTFMRIPADLRDEQARAWYHRHLPGGLPRNWINAGVTWFRPEVVIRYHAALLEAYGLLHVKDDGSASDYKDCRLCRAAAHFPYRGR